MIRAEGVTKQFGELTALGGVDLIAPAGKVFGLLGPNGAGKTTLVRIMTTLMAPDDGIVQVAGVDVLKNPDGARRLIGLAGQYAAIDENLTGRENIEMVGQLYHLSKRDAQARASELLERFSLTDAADRIAKNYSGGMRRRLDLSASLAGHPQVLFLDEPTTGLDPRTRLELWDMIRELVQGGTTLLLTTQYLEEADELADRIAVIDHGLIIAEGTSSELKAGIGGDVLEVTVEPHDLDQAAGLIAPLATGEPTIDQQAARITVPLTVGVDGLIESVRRLDAAGIRPTDIHIRRPSLDDVFLTLTGHPAEVATEASNDILTGAPSR